MKIILVKFHVRVTNNNVWTVQSMATQKFRRVYYKVECTSKKKSWATKPCTGGLSMEVCLKAWCEKIDGWMVDEG